MSTVLYDVIIVGAGAAGIACATELKKKNKKVLILEARDRIGGRGYTVKDFRSQQPVELGAEFIHGNPSSTMGYLQQLQLPFYDVCDNHLFFENGKINSMQNFWDVIDGLIGRISQKGPDQTLAHFLDSLKKVSRRDKSLLRAYVEGFHAADLNRIGEKGLLNAEGDDDHDDLNGSELFRLICGYRDFLERLLSSFEGLSDSVLRNTVVKQVDFSQKNVVAVEAVSFLTQEPISFKCQKLVITVPIGVLKAPAEAVGGIRWIPHGPRGLEKALDAVEMGCIEKLVLTFRSRFWEELSSKPPSFFHTTAEHFFPTWWTLAPLRTPHLIAWQGGPKAQQMATWSQSEKIKAALATLSLLTKKSPQFLQQELECCQAHDWTQDPFSRGAYSYIAVHGVSAAANLRKVFEKNLFFAGEGTSSGPQRGTLHGALESGLRAAKQIIANE